MGLVLDFRVFALLRASVAQSVCQDAVPLTSGSGAHTGVPARTANPAELGTSPVYLDAQEGVPVDCQKACRENQEGGKGKPGRVPLTGSLQAEKAAPLAVIEACGSRRLHFAVLVPVVCGKPVEIPEVGANFPEVRKGFCNYSGSTSGKQLLYIYIFIEYSGGTGGRMGNLYVCEETITMRREVLERRFGDCVHSLSHV